MSFARLHGMLVTSAAVLALVLLVPGCGGTGGSGGSGAFKEYDIPSEGAAASAVAVDTQGRVWFTESATDKIGMLDPKTKKIEEYPLSTRNAALSDIAVAVDGAVWYAAPAIGSVGSLDPTTKAINQIRLIRMSADPTALDVTKDSVWAVEPNNGMITRIFFDGRDSKEFVMQSGSGPTDAAADGKGQLWMTAAGHAAISVLTTDAQIVPSASPEGTPWALTLDEAGDVWYVCSDAPKAGHLSASTGEIEMFDLPDVPGQGTSVAMGPDGNVWFLAVGKGKVCSLNPEDGKVTEYQIPTSSCEPRGLSIAENGDVWFVESAKSANKVGVLKGAAKP